MQQNESTIVQFDGLTREQVLCALYNASKPQGMGIPKMQKNLIAAFMIAITDRVLQGQRLNAIKKWDFFNKKENENVKEKNTIRKDRRRPQGDGQEDCGQKERTAPRIAMRMDRAQFYPRRRHGRPRSRLS